MDALLARALERRADERGTSPEYEALMILRHSFLTEAEACLGLGSRIAALFARFDIGNGLEEAIASIEWGGFQVPGFDLDVEEEGNTT